MLFRAHLQVFNAKSPNINEVYEVLWFLQKTDSVGATLQASLSQTNVYVIGSTRPFSPVQDVAPRG